MTLLATSLAGAAGCGALLASRLSRPTGQLDQLRNTGRLLANISRRLRAIRHHAIHILEGGGHHPHLTDPQAVMAAIVPWLRSLAKDPPPKPKGDHSGGGADRKKML